MTAYLPEVRSRPTSFDYVRKAYGVPAMRGVRVRYTGCGRNELGTITSGKGGLIRVRLDGHKRPLLFHPTWEIEYLEPPPRIERPPSPIATDHVLTNYMPIPESGCWLWLGAWHRSGYGKVNKRGRVVAQAHRLFYAEHVGPIPDGLLVCHKCDTPACVNPAHLFLGTHQDNTDDKMRKGRHHCQRVGSKP